MEKYLKNTKEIIENLQIGKEVYFKNDKHLVEYRLESGKECFYSISKGRRNKINPNEISKCYITDDRYYIIVKNRYISHTGDFVLYNDMFACDNYKIATNKFIELKNQFFNDNSLPQYSWGNLNMNICENSENELLSIKVEHLGKIFKMAIIKSNILPVKESI